MSRQLPDDFGARGPAVTSLRRRGFLRYFAHGYLLGVMLGFPVVLFAWVVLS